MGFFVWVWRFFVLVVVWAIFVVIVGFLFYLELWFLEGSGWFGLGVFFNHIHLAKNMRHRTLLQIKQELF